jgi:hypothetical protein
MFFEKYFLCVYIIAQEILFVNINLSKNDIFFKKHRIRTILVLYFGGFGRKKGRKTEKKKGKIGEKNKKTIDKSSDEWYYINMNGITIPFSRLFSQARGARGIRARSRTPDCRSCEGDKF